MDEQEITELIVTEQGYGRFTKDEIDKIIITFKENEGLLKLLRKVFIPKADFNAPLGQMIDMYIGIKLDDRTDSEIARDLKAREDMYRHLELHLQELSILANARSETSEEKAKRIKANSSK